VELALATVLMLAMALMLVPALAWVSALAVELASAPVLVALAEALHTPTVAVGLASWLEQAWVPAPALVQHSHLPRPISTGQCLFQ
jgi:hypothetical protein